MSCVPLDIHKSKLVIVDIHFPKTSKTYVCLVFSTMSYNTSWLKASLEGKTT